MAPGPASLSAGILITCLWGVRELVPFLSSGSGGEFVENEVGAATEQLSDRAFDVLSRVLENHPTCVCNVVTERASRAPEAFGFENTILPQHAVNIVVACILCVLCFGLGLCLGWLCHSQRRVERQRSTPQRLNVGALEAARRRAHAISE